MIPIILKNIANKCKTTQTFINIDFFLYAEIKNPIHPQNESISANNIVEIYE
jgi:hypothetical protein